MVHVVFRRATYHRDELPQLLRSDDTQPCTLGTGVMVDCAICIMGADYRGATIHHHGRIGLSGGSDDVTSRE